MGLPLRVKIANLISPAAYRAKDIADFATTDRGWSFLAGQPHSGWKSGNEMWEDLSISELETAFSKHPTVQGCVRAIGNAAAVPRIEIGKWISGQWQPLKAHPALDLLSFPTPAYTQNEFLEVLTARLILTGFAFTWKVRSKGVKRYFRPSDVGPVGRLWPIPTSWVTSTPSKNGDDLWDAFKVKGNSGLIPRNDMCIMREIDPASTSRAVSRLQSAFREYRLDLARSNYQAESLLNLKVPGVVIRIPPGLDEGSKEDIRKQYASRFGLGRRGGPMLVEGDGDITIQDPLKDLDWPGLTSLAETRICSALGVPPIVVHARAGLEHATYANYAAARRAFYVETMSPIWDKLGDSFTAALLHVEGEPDLVVRFRYDELPEFQEDRDKTVNRATRLFVSRVIDLHEARAEMGLPPVAPLNLPVVYGHQTPAAEAPTQ